MKKNLTHMVYFALDSFIVFIILIFISCTGGNNDSIPISNLGGRVNSAGYPDVSGNYSFITGEISYTCSKGSSGTSPPIAINFIMAQTDNQLSANISELPTGFTIIDGSELAGYIQKTGKFTMDQNLTVTIDSIPGSNVITYNISGNFHFSGWAGDYTYNVFNDYSNDTCTYTTTFTGDYISP
jgi:hypothetical protein